MSFVSTPENPHWALTKYGVCKLIAGMDGKQVPIEMTKRPPLALLFPISSHLPTFQIAPSLKDARSNQAVGPDAYVERRDHAPVVRSLPRGAGDFHLEGHEERRAGINPDGLAVEVSDAAGERLRFVFQIDGPDRVEGDGEAAQDDAKGETDGKGLEGFVGSGGRRGEKRRRVDLVGDVGEQEGLVSRPPLCDFGVEGADTVHQVR